jgi:hypothetical protein
MRSAPTGDWPRAPPGGLGIRWTYIPSPSCAHQRGCSVKVRVLLHSEPSPGREYYSGHVDVEADSFEEAGEAAKRKLRATAFPERALSSWRIDRVIGEMTGACRGE